MSHILEVQEILNKFPEVKWDRFVGGVEKLFTAFGWIEKHGEEYSDFICIEIEEGKVFNLLTSSTRHAKDFSRRLGFSSYGIGMSIQEIFKGGVKTVEDTKKPEKENLVEFPIGYMFDKSDIVGKMIIQKKWVKELTPLHRFELTGKFTSKNKFKVMQVSLVK